MEAGHELPKSWTFLNNLELVFQDFFPGPQRVSYYYYYIYSIYIYILYIRYLEFLKGGYSPGERGGLFFRERASLFKFSRFSPQRAQYWITSSPNSDDCVNVWTSSGGWSHMTAVRQYLLTVQPGRLQHPTPGWELHLRVPGSRLRLVGALVEVHKLPAVAVLPVQLCSLPDSWVSTGLAARSDERAAMASA